jgi:hypothetical protein
MLAQQAECHNELGCIGTPIVYAELGHAAREKLAYDLRTHSKMRVGYGPTLAEMPCGHWTYMRGK